MRTLQLRHLERPSTVHRLRGDVKIVSLVAIDAAVAFNPGWGVIAGGWAAWLLVFAAARLPWSIVAPPPRMYFVLLGFGALFSLFSGGSPVVAGVEMGGVIEFAQLVSVGLLLVAFAALLAWTTSPTEIGLGLGSLLRPLRRVRVPVDEIVTTVVLSIRALPLITDEVRLAAEVRQTRPTDPRARRGIRGALAEGVDFGATIVVGAHRRSRELAKAMVARGSVVAPPFTMPPMRAADIGALLLALIGCVATFFVA